MTKNLSILGSTGSIGRQTLDVCDGLDVKVVALTAGHNVERMAEQCREYRPQLAVMATREAAEQLAAKGISARVVDMHTIKPLDVGMVKDCIENIGKIITIEDHNILNGLGSAVADIVAESGKAVLRRIGIQDQYGQSAPYERLLEMNGITVENIVANAEGL